MRDKRHVALCFFLAFVISITYAFCAERETSSQEPKDITQLRILYELPIPEPVDTDIIEEVEQVEEEIIEPTQPLYTAQEFKYNGVIWYNGLK